MPWLLIATAYDGAALARTAGEHLDPAAFRHNGASGRITRGSYALHQTATAAEAARTARPAVLGPEERMHAGPRG
jgi:hypothetical protein